jgi:hypothetical protein
MTAMLETTSGTGSLTATSCATGTAEREAWTGGFLGSQLNTAPTRAPRRTALDLAAPPGTGREAGAGRSGVAARARRRLPLTQ